MHWFPVLERTEQHVACKGAGMHVCCNGKGNDRKDSRQDTSNLFSTQDTECETHLL